jgi:hypothetical protein
MNNAIHVTVALGAVVNINITISPLIDLLLTGNVPYGCYLSCDSRWQIHDLGYMNLDARMSHVALNRRVVRYNTIVCGLQASGIPITSAGFVINPGPSRCRNGPSCKRQST